MKVCVFILSNLAAYPCEWLLVSWFKYPIDLTHQIIFSNDIPVHVVSSSNRVQNRTNLHHIPKIKVFYEIYFTQMLIAICKSFSLLFSWHSCRARHWNAGQSYLTRYFKKAFSKSEIKEKTIQYVTNFLVSEFELFSIARMEAHLLRKCMVTQIMFTHQK